MQDWSSMHLDTMEAHTASLQAVTELVIIIKLINTVVSITEHETRVTDPRIVTNYSDFQHF